VSIIIMTQMNGGTASRISPTFANTAMDLALGCVCTKHVTSPNATHFVLTRQP
jgi:hypothetical protein